MPIPALDMATVFAGRQPELDALTARLEQAAAGRGGIVLLAGEPGIGKTRLAEEVAKNAEQHGVRVLWGRCYDGDGAPAFWPWIEVLRTALRQIPSDGSAAQPGDDGETLVRLLPEIESPARDLDGGAGAGAARALDPAQARFRLFDAVATFLYARAAARPQLLILDDLQWADTSSLLLLQFLARDVRSVPLLVVGTYRDTEVDRGHPLTATLAALATRGFGRLVLQGVSSEAVAAIAADAYGLDMATPSFTEALHQLTGGNPLFVRETLRHLIELGWPDAAARPGDGAAMVAAIDVPEGVRWLLRQRLARLSEDAGRILSTASVAGREFDVATLTALQPATRLTVVEALTEAEAARLITVAVRSRSGAAQRYRFAHDLIRETLYGDLSSAARIRLHRGIGEALEDRGQVDVDRHLSEIAYHFVQAAPIDGAAKAVTYARRAGDRAMSRFAYDEAARWYEIALEVIGEGGAIDEARRCDLLLAQGEALLPAGDLRRVIEVIAPAALALAETLGEERRGRAARACRLALAGVIRSSGPGTLVGTPLYRMWAERFDRFAPSDTADRVYADIALADALSTRGALAETLRLYQRALTLARTLDDRDALYYAAFQLLNWSGGPRHQDGQRRLAEEFVSRPREGVQPRNLGRVLWRGGAVLLNWGERERTESLWHEVSLLAARSHERDLLLYGPIGEAILATVDGWLEEALRAILRLIEQSAALGSPTYGRRYAVRLQERALLLLGSGITAPATLPPDLDPSTTGDVWTSGNAASAALRRAQDGDTAGAERLLDTAMQQLEADREDANFPWHLVTLLELATTLGDRRAAEVLAARLAPLASCATADWGLTTVARHLGAAAALLGDRTAAQDLYERALAVAGAIHFRPEMALTTLQIAELLAQDPQEHDAARRHLEQAIGEFRAMNMQPALDRAQRLLPALDSTKGRRRGLPYSHDLTRREAEVLTLLAAGRSNREIADTLVLSSRTVEHHIARIYAKIGAGGRVEATAYALRHGLGPEETRSAPA